MNEVEVATDKKVWETDNKALVSISSIQRRAAQTLFLKVHFELYGFKILLWRKPFSAPGKARWAVSEGLGEVGEHEWASSPGIGVASPDSPSSPT